MPAAVAIPAIASVVTAGGSAAIAAKSASSARKAEEKARQEALTHERGREARAERERRRRWDAYQTSYRDWYARYGDRGINRYGVPVGLDYRSGSAAPGAPGAAGAAGADEMVKLAGGRQVPKSEYDAYVARRDQTPLRSATAAPAAVAPSLNATAQVRHGGVRLRDLMRPGARQRPGMTERGPIWGRS